MPSKKCDIWINEAAYVINKNDFKRLQAFLMNIGFLLTIITFHQVSSAIFPIHALYISIQLYTVRPKGHTNPFT